jgi:hypothetical protein
LDLLGAHFEESGGGLGGLGAPFGGFRGRLAAILGRLEAILEAILRQHDFRMFFDSILEASWAPKGW